MWSDALGEPLPEGLLAQPEVYVERERAMTATGQRMDWIVREMPMVVTNSVTYPDGSVVRQRVIVQGRGDAERLHAAWMRERHRMGLLPGGTLMRRLQEGA